MAFQAKKKKKKREKKLCFSPKLFTFAGHMLISRQRRPRARRRRCHHRSSDRSKVWIHSFSINSNTVTFQWRVPHLAGASSALLASYQITSHLSPSWSAVQCTRALNELCTFTIILQLRTSQQRRKYHLAS